METPYGIPQTYMVDNTPFQLKVHINSGSKTIDKHIIFCKCNVWAAYIKSIFLWKLNHKQSQYWQYYHFCYHNKRAWRVGKFFRRRVPFNRKLEKTDKRGTTNYFLMHTIFVPRHFGPNLPFVPIWLTAIVQQK